MTCRNLRPFLLHLINLLWDLFSEDQFLISIFEFNQKGNVGIT